MKLIDSVKGNCFSGLGVVIMKKLFGGSILVVIVILSLVVIGFD